LQNLILGHIYEKSFAFFQLFSFKVLKVCKKIVLKDATLISKTHNLMQISNPLKVLQKNSCKKVINLNGRKI
jgi:hypothetical protein